MAAYRTLSQELRETFGRSVHKVSVDAGFSCPNVDGTVARGGCTYCRTESYTPTYADAHRPVSEQIRLGAARVRRRRVGKDAALLVYFQPNSNTHLPALWRAQKGSLERAQALAMLRGLYEAALAAPNVVGLAIGTRPDCVPDDVLDVLADFSRRTYLWLELGLQSAKDATLQAINRSHSVAQFCDAVDRAHRSGLRVCAHVIIGLPGEQWNDWMVTADTLARCRVEGVKIHPLHVVRGTRMAEEYARGGVEVMSIETYARAAAAFIRRLPEGTVVHRVTGHAPADLTVAPEWTLNKHEVSRCVREFFSRGVAAPAEAAATGATAQ
ncbi:MAG: TIGR01212 family radical SAM protein [Nitrospirae bacterium]|nr:TIGR01212 family radical SAM protein [Nitrospirota bacterium]